MTPVLDHIGIFVPALDPALEFYGKILGLGEAVVREIPELGLRLAFFDNPAGTIIELVEASGKTELQPGDVVVALEVEDLDAAIADYRARGLKVYDQPATENLPLRRGWIPKGAGHGTVIELCPKGAVAAFVRGTL
ncbi:VOC family protein [Pontitalea aquivivens]|uniref:VOC family protein n=1 Tax=Pontitalea aquivivens TaxID=3388663 RepID=UPI0039708BAE